MNCVSSCEDIWSVFYHWEDDLWFLSSFFTKWFSGFNITFLDPTFGCFCQALLIQLLDEADLASHREKGGNSSLPTKDMVQRTEGQRRRWSAVGVLWHGHQVFLVMRCSWWRLVQLGTTWYNWSFLENQFRTNPWTTVLNFILKTWTKKLS